MRLAEKVFAFECEVSFEDFALGEKENIDKLKTLDEVKEYYLDFRGWRSDDSLIELLFDFIINLKSEELN